LSAHQLLSIQRKEKKNMTRVIVTCLMAGGLMLAATPSTNSQAKTHLSADERLALETSSPPVKVEHMYHKHQRSKDIANGSNGYRVVKDKTTINAFIPMGK
jgi:hypothetical protein